MIIKEPEQFGGRFYDPLTCTWKYSDGSGVVPEELVPNSYTGVDGKEYIEVEDFLKYVFRSMKC